MEQPFVTPNKIRKQHTPSSKSSASSINSQYMISSSTTSSSRRHSSTTPRSTPSSRMNILDDNDYIIAVTENRVREIGVAILNITCPELRLSSFTDSHTYMKLITIITIYSPKKIIIPKTSLNSELHQILAAKSTELQVEITFLARQFFDETKGAKYISHLAVPRSTIADQIATKYLCLASVAAIIRYSEFEENITYATNSLKISFTGDGTMIIDRSTLINLEIVKNIKTGSKKGSLLSLLDHTKTTSGSRLLRVNICQPPNDLNTICTRLDCLDELLYYNERYFSLSASLIGFCNLDPVISHLVKLEKRTEAMISYQRDISTVFSLKKVLESTSKISQALDEFENELFKAIKRNMEDPNIELLLAKINKMVSDESSVVPFSQSKIQHLFCIKPGINGLLDVARKTYSETIEDIYTLCESTREKHGWKNLVVKYNPKRGFYFVTTNYRGEFPPYCLQLKTQKNVSTFSTESLIRLNERQKESMKEITILCSRVVAELLHEIRNHIATIYNINDSVAVADMLVSLATYCTLSREIAKPEITRDGPIAIKSGRNPLMEVCLNNHFIPNDTYCSKDANFHLITGPNMSGKSTYIRQVAMNVILAHVGCFIPAKFASIRLTDQIFSRISTSDSIEDNASSFMMEMKEMAFILQNATANSLVIIDELGRGTSTEEGISIAFSLSEEILLKQPFVFFVTHFKELEILGSIYPNVKTYHLVVDASDDNKVKFSYELSAGFSENQHYGITTAQHAGFPDSVIKEAKEILASLDRKENEIDYNNHPRVLKFIDQIKNVYKSDLQENNDSAALLQEITNEIQNFILHN